MEEEEEEEEQKKKWRKDTYGAERGEKKAEREKDETCTTTLHSTLSLDGQMTVFGGWVHPDWTGDDLWLHSECSESWSKHSLVGNGPLSPQLWIVYQG